MNIEEMKTKARIWWYKGEGYSGSSRTDDEVNAYLEGLEDAIQVAYESNGKTSMATYESVSTFNEIYDYFEELKTEGE